MVPPGDRPILATDSPSATRSLNMSVVNCWSHMARGASASVERSMQSLSQRILVAEFLVVFLASAVLAKADENSTPSVGFRDDVWPILKRHCWGCHSGGKPKGGLRVDSVAAMLKGGDSGPVIDRKAFAESLLLTSVEGDEPDMPPEKPLSAAKVQVLRRWLELGASDDGSPSLAGHEVIIPDVYDTPPAVTAVAYSPTSDLIAAACRSEVVLIGIGETPETKDSVGPATPQHRLKTNCDLVTNVAFSPDGKTLAVSGGSPGQYGEVRFFSMPDAKLISERRVSHDTLFRGGFAPDGASVVVGAADGTAYIVPTDLNAEPRKLELHSDWVFDASFTPDGTKVVTAGRDKATKVASVETGQLLRSVDSSSQMVNAVAADNAFAISAGNARQLISYDFKVALANIQVTGAGNGARPISKRAQYAKAFEGQSGAILDMDLSDDHKLLAVAGTGADVRIYSVADRKRVGLISGLQPPVYSVALNRDGTRVTIGTRSGLVEVFDVGTGKKLHSLVPVPIAEAKTASN